MLFGPCGGTIYTVARSASIATGNIQLSRIGWSLVALGGLISPEVRTLFEKFLRNDQAYHMAGQVTTGQ